jgi:uncharacterized protein (TIGR02599 family)
MLIRHRARGFTLIELVASAAVITLLMLMLVQMSKSTADTWKKGLSRAEEFRESRRAYEMVTRRLATATLNTYWDYQYDKGIDPSDPKAIEGKYPIGYQRQSELRFRNTSMANIARETGFHPGYGIFFQSQSATVDIDDPYWSRAFSNRNDRSPVTRLDGMLNTWGYFLEVADSTKLMPGFLAQDTLPRFRSRLVEFRQDATKLSVYKIKNNQASDIWFTDPIGKTDADRPVHIISENIIALVFLPRLSAQDEAARKADTKIGPQYQMLSPTFEYDSKQINNYGGAVLSDSTVPNQINPYNQLPPVVTVAMVALDENSANRLAVEATDKRTLDLAQLTDNLFQTADALETHDSQQGDLSKLEDRLLKRKFVFRIFTSNVSIRGARWSTAHVDLHQ